MEYQGQGWMNPDSNMAFAKERDRPRRDFRSPVCDMGTRIRATAPRSAYGGKTYYFCSSAHKDTFDALPAKWVKQGP